MTNKPWYEWESSIRKGNKTAKRKWMKREDVQQEYLYQSFIQFLFFRQWNALKTYANKNGISIIGDIPIFVADNSADVWANRKLFKLDKDGHPTAIAGVPPDYFSETGQLWGNPLISGQSTKKTVTAVDEPYPRSARKILITSASIISAVLMNTGKFLQEQRLLWKGNGCRDQRRFL